MAESKRSVAVVLVARGVGRPRSRGIGVDVMQWVLCATCLASIAAAHGELYAQEERGISTEGLSDLAMEHLRFGQEEYVSLLEAREFASTANGGQGRKLPYRLFVPRNLESGKTYPLIVWVHGYGDQERIDINRNTGQLKHTRLIFKDLKAIEDYRFYFLAAQNQRSGAWFDASAVGGGSPTCGEMLLELIDQTIARHSIDPQRVTMVGISSGATASWELAARRPDLFAALAPLASTGGDLNRLQPLVGMPVWAFHTEGDSATPEGDARTIERLRSLGGCAQLTLNPGKEHDCWTAAFKNHGLLQWLLERRKGEACPIVGPTLVDAIKASATSAAQTLPAACTLLAIVAAIVCLLRPPAGLKRLLK